MATSTASLPIASPLVTRLSRLSPLEPREIDLLRGAERDLRRFPARREMVSEGTSIGGPRAIVSGWACRQRIVSDGCRQILSFMLPGDLIGICHHTDPVSVTSILAITEVVTVPVPDAEMGNGLREAYARSLALDEAYLLAQITRLGRLNAQERLADWLLEKQERLALAGLAAADHFPLPLTQEMLADALGLTSVHVNRTLQTLRRDGLLDVRRGMASFPDRDRLEKLVDYQPARISSDG